MVYGVFLDSVSDISDGWFAVPSGPDGVVSTNISSTTRNLQWKIYRRDRSILENQMFKILGSVAIWSYYISILPFWGLLNFITTMYIRIFLFSKVKSFSEILKRWLTTSKCIFNDCKNRWNQPIQKTPQKNYTHTHTQKVYKK